MTKEIFIERYKEVLRIAVMEDKKLSECFIEEDNNEVYQGQIYKGIVKNIVPAIKCAFIDIGKDKNCYMYMDSKFNNTHIKKGEEILVEVVKESIGDKGPKVTNAITIPGRYSVIITLNKDINFSKKINDESFIAGIGENLKKPEDVGVMIRTNAQNVDFQFINEEINRLYAVYLGIAKEGLYSSKPRILYNAGGVLGKVLRDNIDANTAKIIVNSKDDYEFIKNYVGQKEDINLEIELHDKCRTLLDYYGIEKELLRLRNNKVYLKCGGSIIIDKTEAMYVIDVNSGKNVKSNSIDKTAEITDLQAAEEIVRQIRLRNLSGIIIVDFIDINSELGKNNVINKLEQGFQSDKNKTIIYPFTELNLVQIARRRRGKSIHDYIEQQCECCNGSGKRLKNSYLNMLIRNELFRLSENENFDHIYMEINAIYEDDILNNLQDFIGFIGAKNKNFYAKFVDNIEYFKLSPLIFKSQRDELKECLINKGCNLTDE
ncbi:MAG: ribonuclease E/G [Bacillota bacterium]|nr:ribonuclease E/G [Bacillota bacterium]